jgi:uncharacterized membrane protein (DUF106 family)
MDQIKASQKANSAAEQGKYREEVEKDRERAQKQKSKFSKGQIKAVRALPWVVVCVFIFIFECSGDGRVRRAVAHWGSAGSVERGWSGGD